MDRFPENRFFFFCFILIILPVKRYEPEIELKLKIKYNKKIYKIKPTRWDALRTRDYPDDYGGRPALRVNYRVSVTLRLSHKKKKTYVFYVSFILFIFYFFSMKIRRYISYDEDIAVSLRAIVVRKKKTCARPGDPTDCNAAEAVSPGHAVMASAEYGD